MLLDETDAPVVPVQLADRAETLIERVLQTGARRVQLLVPDGVQIFQDDQEVARLCRLAAVAEISLVLFSTDPATLAAAHRGGIASVAIVGVPVRRQPTPPTDALPSADVPLSAAGATFPKGFDDLDTALKSRLLAAEADALATTTATAAAALNEPPPPPPPPLSDAELLAAALATPPEPPPSAAPPAPEPRRAPPPPVFAPKQTHQIPPPARRQWPLVVLAVVLLVLVGGGLLWSSRVTVTIMPPLRPDLTEPIRALPVSLVQSGSSATTAVVAESVRSDVTFTSDGQVTEGTLTPAGSASGSVTIFNSTQQTIMLPAGSEFIAFKNDGQAVPFVSTADVQVPGASTSDTGAQIITSRGQANIPITARSPGSTSNSGANTIRRVVPLGGNAFNVDSGGLIVQHAALTGGSEEQTYIVKESNVQSLIAAALEGLDAEARRQLDRLALARGLTLDATTVIPRRADLEQLQGFEYSVLPPIGQTLDPAKPQFTLTVRATYSALAVPPNKPLERQLGPVLSEQLLQAGRLTIGDCRAPAITNWRWDGKSLLVDGQIAPDTRSPSCIGNLDAGLLRKVREAVRGKTYAEAQSVLTELVAQGVISGYTLPNVQRLPQWDWQINVH